MKATADSANAEFLFGRIHALWSKALPPEKLRALLSTSFSAAREETLKAAGIDPAGLADGSRSPCRRLIEELATLRAGLDEPAGALYSCFIDRYFLDNLLAILRARLIPDLQGDLNSQLMDSPHLPPLRVELLLRASSATQMHELLPPNPFRRGLLPILKEFDAQGDLFLVESRLDALFYATVSRAIGSLTGEIAASASALLGAELDIVHVMMLLRNVTTYHLPPDRLEPLFFGNGRLITRTALAALARQTEPNALAERLPAPYAGAVRRLGTADLPAVEDALWNIQYRRIEALFRDFSAPENAITAFPFLKRCEHRNIVRLVEGLRLGITPDGILPTLIGAPRV